MVKYTCEICDKVFTQKGHLEVHKNRKRPCKKNNMIEVIVAQKVKEALINKEHYEQELEEETKEEDYSKNTREELIVICKEKHIKGYSGKKKSDILNLLENSKHKNNIVKDIVVKDIVVNNENKLLNMVDLFAGTGAFSYAFTQTQKVSVVFANDMVAHSKIIYDANFGHALTLQDLNDVNVADIPQHDLLTGGFPCQPFSIAGKQEGFNDERSNVFWKILKILDCHEPEFVVLENVKNIVSHDNGETFKTIKVNLQNRGYHICHKVLNTAEITGIPHHRERIYIVCIKSKAKFDQFNLNFPHIDKRPISDFLEVDIPVKYYYTDKSSTWNLLHAGVTKRDTIYQYRRVYIRENMSGECPTLTANMGTGGHNVPIILDNNGIRKLTPRECFNLQGFPASYQLPPLSDANLYKLAGNAVSVPVVELIAERLLGL